MDRNKNTVKHTPAYPSPGPILKQKTEEELRKSKPQVTGEQSVSGHMPNPQEVQEKDTLERAQNVGLYTEADEEHPVELNIAKEINDAEKAISEDYGIEKVPQKSKKLKTTFVKKGGKSGARSPQDPIL